MGWASQGRRRNVLRGLIFKRALAVSPEWLGLIQKGCAHTRGRDKGDSWSHVGFPSPTCSIPHLEVAGLWLSALGWNQQHRRNKGGNGALRSLLQCCCWHGTAFRAGCPASSCCSAFRAGWWFIPRSA